MLLFVSANLRAATGISASAALLEGADTLAAQLSVTVAASLAQTEGADVLSAQVGPLVAGNASLTDGADQLAAQGGPQIALALSSTDGADSLAAAISVSASGLSLSAALLPGADLLQAEVSSSPAAAGGGGARKRYLVERRGVLLQFASRQEALDALDAPDGADDVTPKQAAPVALKEPVALEIEQATPLAVIDLPQLQAYADAIGQQVAFEAAYRSRHFAALLALFAQQQEEEELDLLLLSL